MHLNWVIVVAQWVSFAVIFFIARLIARRRG